MSFKAIDHKDDLRPEGKTCILVYGYDPIELNYIEKYAHSINGIETIEIKAGNTHKTLGELINDSEDTPSDSSTHVKPSEPAIILNAVSQSELNQFVQNFRTLKLKSPLFAMVTETSIKWKFDQLIHDLIEERTMMRNMRAQQANR